ncbi:DUF4129 domain-containing protein [Halosimplex amylolyticum]|uniref:DUF4129 domain-containing protein n=1 Tax=Halosimplex amylolyticum TaxID=3396616 RepID=UPI003F550FD0
MDDYLSRASLRVLVVGLVAMAAVAVGAAAITSAVEPAAPSTQPGDEAPEPDVDSVAPETPSDPGPGPDTVGDPNPPDDPIETSWCVQPLSAWYGGVVYFGAFAAALVAIKRRYSLGATFFGLYALAPPAFLTYFLSTDCPDYDGPGLGPGPDLPGSGGDGGLTEPLIHAVDVPPEAVLGAFGVVLVGTAAILLRASGGESVTDVSQEPLASDDGEPVGPRDLAVAAGRAADRLEGHDADVDNEVYRAWWEMTSLLDVANPDCATPGEFADAAVDVGMSEADVAELTRLFEEVRYGERDAARREEHAVSVFRAVEESYGDGATAHDSRSDESTGER